MTQQTNKPDIAQELTTIYTTPKPSPEFVNKLERQLMREALNQSQTIKKRSWFSLEALFAGWGVKTAVSFASLALIVWLGTWFIQQNTMNTTLQSMSQKKAVSPSVMQDGETNGEIPSIMPDGENNAEFPFVVPNGETPEFIVRHNITSKYTFAILTKEGNIYDIVEDISSWEVLEPILSPDTQYLAYAENGQIFVKSLATQETIQITSDEKGWRFMQWSPSGRYLLYETGSNTSNIFDLQSGETKTITTMAKTTFLHGIEWGETDQLLIIIQQDATPIQYNWHTDQYTTLSSPSFYTPSIILNFPPVFEKSPDRSKNLIQDASNNTLNVFTIEGEKQTIYLDEYGFDNTLRLEKWLPNSDGFLAIYDHKIYTFYLDGREPELVVDYTSQFSLSDNLFVQVIDISPDNQVLLVEGSGGIQYLYDIENESWQLLSTDIIYLGWWPQPK